MTHKTLVIAPHADDELLGCGGLMLRRVAEGASVGWALLTSMRGGGEWSDERVSERAGEIDLVRSGLNISSENFFDLGYLPAQLDRVPFGDLVGSVSSVILSFEPNEILIPFAFDAHSDHRVAHNAAVACTKWFRYPSINRVLVYETLSETNFSSASQFQFTPNIFFDISPYLEEKILLMNKYKSEVCEHPFPRSVEAIKALSILRGSQSGYTAAEGFQLIFERA